MTRYPSHSLLNLGYLGDEIPILDPHGGILSELEIGSEDLMGGYGHDFMDIPGVSESPYMDLRDGVIDDPDKTASILSEITKVRNIDYIHASPEEMKGSVFKIVLEMLHSTGYKIAYEILNAADYGSPQKRERIIFIGLRDGKPSLPEKTHTENPQMQLGSDALLPWNTLWECTADLEENEMEYINFSKKIEPLWASWNSPILFCVAWVKAPFL